MQAVTRRTFLAAAAAAPLAAGTAAAAQTPKPKFRLGLVTYNVAKDWDLATLLAHCKSAGVAAVECRTTHQHGVEPALTRDQRDRMKKQFADSGVLFWGSGSTCEFHAPDDKVVAKNVEDCKRFLTLVRDLGGKGVKVRPNGVTRGRSVEESCDRIAAALKLCGQAAADLGLEIWVEVHGSVTQNPPNMHRIMAATDHPAVGVTWNSNPTDLVKGSIAEAFKLLAPYIKSCHINDLDGPYPYRDLFARLAGIGYDRVTLCEVGQAVPAADGAAWLAAYKAKWQGLVG